MGTVRMMVLCALAACLAAHAQTAAPTQSGSYRIAGRVVNAITGEPVRRATVSALNEEEGEVVASAVSDGDGHFAIEKLPAGKYPLTASKRGFHTGFFDEHDDGFNSAIVAGEGQETENLEFRLMPRAVLHGVVTGDGGDPVEGAQVVLARRRTLGSSADQPIIQADNATTDDTGAYEFSNLTPGDYAVVVKADPWYAQHQPAAKNGMAGGMNLDVAYPLTFYDSTTDENAATWITLAGSDRQQADIALHAVAAVHMRFTAPAGHHGGFRAELRQSVFGIRIFSEGYGYAEEDKAVEHSFVVAPGKYEVEMGDVPRVQGVNAGTDLELDPNAGTPTMAVSGTLAMADGGPVPELVNLALMPANGAPQEAAETGSRKGRFEFNPVPPGEWTVQAAPMGNQSPGETLTVVSVATGNAPAAGNHVTVADKPVTVVITLSRSQTRVQGFARKGGKGFSGAMIVLVPREPGAYPALARRDQSDSDGSFSLRDVPAGRYTVVAIEDGWKLDWQNREVIARYLPGGLAVTIEAQAGKVVALRQGVEVQGLRN